MTLSQARSGEQPEPEPLMTKLSEQVRHAQEHMLEAVAPEAIWLCTECGHTLEVNKATPRALQAETRRRCGESSTVVSIAFWDLVNAGKFTVSNDLRVVTHVA